MKTASFFKLILAIIVCELIGGFGALFTFPAIANWYSTLVKPAINPPNWLFGPVWTILFALMGVALWLVWQHGWSKKKVQKAIMVFTIQLFLNVLWSLIFFGLHSPGGAFLEIICLWLGIIITILAFARISKTAAYLLLPYLAWVSFAAYLNFSIWSLN